MLYAWTFGRGERIPLRGPILRSSNDLPQLQQGPQQEDIGPAEREARPHGRKAHAHLRAMRRPPRTHLPQVLPSRGLQRSLIAQAARAGVNKLQVPLTNTP